MKTFGKILVITLLLSNIFISKTLGNRISQQDCVAGYTYILTNDQDSGFVTIQFYDSSYAEQEIVLREWSIGDYIFSNELNPSYTFNLYPGDSVEVCLTITTDDCSDTYCENILINQEPVQLCQAEYYYDVIWEHIDPGYNDSIFIQFYDSSFSLNQIVNWFWDFDDGSYSNQQNPTHLFTNQGIYNVCLYITANDGCTSSYCETIEVGNLDSECQAAFSYYEIIDTSFVGGKLIQFFDSSYSSSSIVQWFWDFGDSTFSNEQDPLHSFPIYPDSPEFYTVCLTVIGEDDCISTYCDSISMINQEPSCKADFFYFLDSTVNCINCYQFVDASVANESIIDWYWDFGDGEVGYGPTLTHTYTIELLEVEVCLTITTLNGCVSTKCKTININGGTGCQADFNYTNILTPFSDHRPIQFIDNSYSSSDIIGWEWDFGDGETSDEQNPYHEYYIESEYVYVCQTIIAADGCEDTYCQNVYLSGVPDTICFSDFSYYRDPTWNSTRYEFYDESIGDSIIDWFWDFGDSSFAYEPNPVHYPNLKPGDIWEVCLTITTINGCTDTYCDIIIFGDIPQPGCNVSFIYENVTDSSYDPDLLYQFYDMSYSSSEIISRMWDFDDGTFKYNRNPMHLFPTPGEYYVCLTIVTDESCSKTYCKNIVVGPVGDYTITGNVYGGDELLNSGIIVLYKESDEFYMPYDAEILTNGNYTFEKLVSGNYIIHAIPNIFIYDEFLPTFYLNKLRWMNADILNVNSDLYDVNIQMIELVEFIGGIGKISGNVKIDDDVLTSRLYNLYSIVGVEAGANIFTSIPVILTTIDGNVLAYTLTDGNGNYEFDNLYYGEYIVFPEIPNVYNSEEVRLTLDTENSEISDVNFIIDKEDMVLSAKPITISVKQPVIFYLNEADELHIITEFNMTKNTRIEIVNYMGQVVMQQDVTINNGFDEIILSLSSLNNNFYIVNMIVEGEQSFSSKFIK